MSPVSQTVTSFLPSCPPPPSFLPAASLALMIDFWALHYNHQRKPTYSSSSLSGLRERTDIKHAGVSVQSAGESDVVAHLSSQHSGGRRGL